ncbi:MAG: hypothetical protein AWU58_1440 [Methanohalophilus sp. T328-1]|uniref:DUF357 domain-containing protein n=1 Tax=Methanohalophilus sp. DAL1 TaxID=1864608 RepID=UPI00079118EB|nr:DUF357 domain-containing protein [Methanohalophilus sp. DAL1]KXS42634.1 MAG: hypothetical protein AWU58_1440 [Methanohalophilus sp. T328-1]OBZ35102.1 MAG: hypothetical protein A9957_00815 [Methanohalophilus sp. DAL1]
MAADLNEKVGRYEKLLKKSLELAQPAPRANSHLMKVADDYVDMAQSYYNDGLHFIKIGDPVNALVCFSYGHAWLDAGAKLGIFDVDDDVLFTI